jgi:AcrR family transcriptional regulator
MTTAARGRPRGFDREAALDKAVLAFWAHGYEATSIADLTREMGINPPSLYAAFGDKRALFSECVERYAQVYGAVGDEAFASGATARDAVEALLRALAVAHSDPGHPPGCLIMTAAENCSARSADVQTELRDRRTAGERAIADRIAADVTAGRLPRDTDSPGLASFVVAIMHGMSARARDGAGRTELEGIAAQAMRAWPATA